MVNRLLAANETTCLHWLTLKTGLNSVFLAIKLGVYYLFLRYYIELAFIGISWYFTSLFS